MGIEVPIPYFVWPQDVRDELERADSAIWRLYNEINERGDLDRSKFDFYGFLAWFQAWRKFYEESKESTVAIYVETVATYNRTQQYEREAITWREQAAQAQIAKPPKEDPLTPPDPHGIKVDDTNFGPGLQAMGIGLVLVAGIFAVGYAARR